MISDASSSPRQPQPRRAVRPLLGALIALAVTTTASTAAVLSPAAAQAPPAAQGVQFGQPIDLASDQCVRRDPVDLFLTGPDSAALLARTNWVRFDLRGAGGVAPGAELACSGANLAAAYQAILAELASRAPHIQVIGLFSNELVWGLRLVDPDPASEEEEGSIDDDTFATRAGQWAVATRNVACDPGYQHIDVWEIWNEPNVLHTHLTPQRYAQLVALTAAQVTSCNPLAFLITGGIAPGREDVSDAVPWDYHPVTYLQRVDALIFQHGYGGYTSLGQAVSGVGIHPYIDWIATYDRRGHACLNDFLHAFRTSISWPGLTPPLLFITEFGWPVTEKPSNQCAGALPPPGEVPETHVNEAVQCHNLIKAFELIRGPQWSPVVVAATWFTLKDFPTEDPDDVRGNHGLYNLSGGARAALDGYLTGSCGPTGGQHDAAAQKLTWQGMAGATGYEVALAKPSDPVFTPKMTVAGTEVAVAELDPLLESGVTYVWKVLALKDGQRYTSPEWEFTHQPSLYPYGIQAVTTEPASYTGHRNLPVLFDGIIEHPNYGIINFTPGPIAVVLTFAQPVTLDAFVTAIGGETGNPNGYRWRVEADPAGNGSYQTVVGEQFSDADLVNIPFPGPVTARAWRITHERFTGDGVEHLREILPVFVDTGANGTATGSVYVDTAAPGNALANAFIQVCAAGGGCRVTVTNTDGRYAVSGLSTGTHTVTAFPPAGSVMLPRSSGPATVTAGATVAVPPIVLRSPQPPPAGTTITSGSTTADGIPVVHWNEPLTLTTQGCAGGTAQYDIARNDAIIRTGPMAEAPAGRYTATIAPLTPEHGPAQVRITLTCPGEPPATTLFDIYIDPSGWVRTVSGTPISGATVVLYRADTPDGPFGIVPDGSAVMSPQNRTNPDTTDATGHFGWDVIAGYYRVRASHPGCSSPQDPQQPYVDSHVMTIPPPVTDLDLRLDCGPAATIDGLVEATQQACQQGVITKPLTCTTLTTAAQSARTLIGMGMTAAARMTLSLYLTTLDLERGTSIPEVTYQQLRTIALAVIASLP